MTPDAYPQPRRPLAPSYRPPAAPKPTGVPWYLRPLYSRGEYSPRLTMAWIVTLFALWLIRRWVTTPIQVINGLLVQPGSVSELVGILLGFSGLLLGLGTFQKVKLGDQTPSQGQIEADASKEASPPESGPQ